MMENPIFGKIIKWIIFLVDWIKSLNKPVINFLPGQMAFLIKGDWSEDELLVWANNLAKDWNPQVEFINPRRLSFGSSSQGALQEAFLPDGSSPRSGNIGFTLIFTDATGIKSPDELLALMKFINEKRGGTDPIASPNWLMSGSSEAGGTGGPGSWPTEAQPQEESWEFQLVDERVGAKVHLPRIGEDGEGWHIAILDTIPTEPTMQEAYVKWHLQHHLLDEINNIISSGQMRIHRDSNSHNPIDDAQIARHPYPMPDHGLFIAGIIHTIAPKAKLHLYEALNQYGMGSFESITTYLNRLFEDPYVGRPLIVNCSFTLDIPVKGTRDLYLETAYADEINEYYKNLFSTLAQPGQVIIVAAAGNDAKCNNSNPDTRPNPRSPATFDSVVAAGALPKGFPKSEDGKFQAANYSNLTDTQEPPVNGFMTLGGEAGPEKGVLGVYTREYFSEPTGCLWQIWSLLTPGNKWYEKCFPPRILWNFIHVNDEAKPNSTGWAWWAGTSFAAAIISGIRASNPSMLDRNHQPGRTGKGETVIPIEQR